MSDVVDARRALVQELKQRDIVDEVDFTRNGFETVVLHLGEPSSSSDFEQCPACGAIGLSERIEDHNCEGFIARRADQ